MLGFRTEHGKLTIVPEEAEIVKRIFHSYVYERGKLSREGRKYSSHYWFSSKVFCGKCGHPYNISGRKNNDCRCLRCVNRTKYGNLPRVDANGAEVGCDNTAFNVLTLETCMKYLIEHIQVSREKIVTQLLTDIQMIQQCEPTADIEPLKAEIDNLSRKKGKLSM